MYSRSLSAIGSCLATTEVEQRQRARLPSAEGSDCGRYPMVRVFSISVIMQALLDAMGRDVRL